MSMFADDTIIMLDGTTRDNVECDMVNCLNKVMQWLMDHKLMHNVSKTKFIILLHLIHGYPSCLRCKSNQRNTTSVFSSEFVKYHESIILSFEPLLIALNSNIHVDDVDNGDWDAVGYVELPESVNVQRHVSSPAH